MPLIQVKRDYCAEHMTAHMVDATGKHIANDSIELKQRGYTYVRHVGAQWYEYRQPFEAEEWTPEMERMYQAHQMELEAKFFSEVDF